VHQKEDLQQDLPADQKVALPQVVILTAHVTTAMTQELLASSEAHVTIQVPHVHHVQNHPIVFQQSASLTIQRAANASLTKVAKENRIKVEIANHSIVTTVKVVNAVPSETVSQLMESVNLIKVESASRIKVAQENHSIAIIAREANVVPSETASHLMGNVNRIKAESASLLAELKIQHVHPIKEIIAGIATRPLK
jgi:hypothetical protein